MELNRRSFLKGAAAMAGASVVAGAGVAGVASAATVEGDGTREAFEAAAAPIAPADVPASWDEEFEVVVVGGGFGGVNATIRLAQAGYKVLLAERSVATGGNSQCSEMFSNFGGHK